MSFNRIISAAERAKPQFSPDGNPEENMDVLKEFALDTMRALSSIVEEAGGDASYIQSYAESLIDDLDCAFAAQIEHASEPDYVDVFMPRPGLRNQLVRGATLQAGE